MITSRPVTRISSPDAGRDSSLVRIWLKSLFYHTWSIRDNSVEPVLSNRVVSAGILDAVCGPAETLPDSGRSSWRRPGAAHFHRAHFTPDRPKRCALLLSLTVEDTVLACSNSPMILRERIIRRNEEDPPQIE